MKVLFWNTQRLGGGSDQKKIAIEAVVAHAIRVHAVDLCLFCELTSGFSFSDITLSKQLAVAKRDRKHSSAQLGYGGIMADTSDAEMVTVEMSKYTELFDAPISYRGGNEFMNQSKRKVAGIGQVGGYPLFMYHANSSYKSTELVRWIVAQLDTDNCRFLLIGDFNCSPADLRAALDWGMFSVVDGGPTHNAKGLGGAQTTLDFAVGKGCMPVVTVVNNVDFFKEAGLDDMPDHLPILVEVA